MDTLISEELLIKVLPNLRYKDSNKKVLPLDKEVDGIRYWFDELGNVYQEYNGLITEANTSILFDPFDPTFIIDDKPVSWKAVFSKVLEARDIS